MKIINKIASNTKPQKFKRGHIYKIVIDNNNEDLLESIAICSDEGKLIDIGYGVNLGTVSLNTNISSLRNAYVEDVTNRSKLTIDNKTILLGDCYE